MPPVRGYNRVTTNPDIYRYERVLGVTAPGKQFSVGLSNRPESYLLTSRRPAK